MGIQMHKVAVVIETARHQICGHVAVPAVSRLSDYANDPQRRFWAVTDAEITVLEHPDRSREVPFLLIAAHEITMISPMQADRPVRQHAQPIDFREYTDPLGQALTIDAA